MRKAVHTQTLMPASLYNRARLRSGQHCSTDTSSPKGAVPLAGAAAGGRPGGAAPTGAAPGAGG